MSESRRLVARTAAVASIAVLALVIVAPLVTSWRPSGVARATTPTDPIHGITVQGTGKITLTPNLASINVGVTFQGATAAKAQGGASAAMARIIAAIKAKGVAEADLASQWVSLQPQYDYSSSGTVPPRVIGFQANQSLSIKVHKIDTSGDVIDAAVGAGATDIGGISFSVSDPAAATAQARTAAITDAKARAKSLADAAGILLGAAISITEVSAPTVVPYPYLDKAAVGAPTNPTPIQVGTTEVEVNVQVTFAIG
ncbi:MAG TPA: SIMPL domain-containing protein [Candidatus Limnocylindrales bacterium]|nr:SIMPL domain-containing protein [Candidatus Limnocylindrales bacterium]